MAYDFALENFLEGPINASDDSRVVEFILGFDVQNDVIQKDIIVVMSVLLAPTDREDTLELCFGIRLKTEDETTLYASDLDYSVEGATKYIPSAYKDQVLMLICEAVTLLVSTTMPSYITMETFYANLPPKALKKYDIIGAKIVVCGYMVGDQFRNPDDGINYWLFEKRN
jgi:hypothetical protein